MYSQLTSIRHDIYTMVITRLRSINDAARLLVKKEPVYNAPSEMGHLKLHRGTQTSPILDPPCSPDLSSATSDDDSTVGQLNQIARRLQSLTSANETILHNEVMFSLTDLSNFINTMTYVSNPYNLLGSAYGVGWSGEGSAANNTKSEDLLSKVKSEIRGVKGSLLNVRNFPSVLQNPK